MTDSEEIRVDLSTDSPTNQDPDATSNQGQGDSSLQLPVIQRQDSADIR